MVDEQQIVFWHWFWNRSLKLANGVKENEYMNLLTPDNNILSFYLIHKATSLVYVLLHHLQKYRRMRFHLWFSRSFPVPLPCVASPHPSMGFLPPPPSRPMYLPADKVGLSPWQGQECWRHPVLEYEGIHMRGGKEEGSRGATLCCGTYHRCKTRPLLALLPD